MNDKQFEELRDLLIQLNQSANITNTQLLMIKDAIWAVPPIAVENYQNHYKTLNRDNQLQYVMSALVQLNTPKPPLMQRIKTKLVTIYKSLLKSKKK